jgi:hypothetical protein
MSSKPPKSIPSDDPRDEGLDALFMRTHEQTQNLFSGLRLVRKRARELGVPEDEHAIKVMFELLVERVKESKTGK